MANIVITGAARGVAFELAKQHAEAGDQVFATCRDPASAEQLHALASASHGKIKVIKLDVTSDDSAREAALATGGVPIDIIYNAAGILGPVKPDLELGADWNAWNHVFNTMAYGPLRVLQAFMPQLHAGSKVLNLTSQLAASTWPRGGLYAYSGSKAAMSRIMRGVAFDLKDRGIIIGIVHPGYVQTDMGGPNADITPTESATGLRKLADEWTLEHSGDFYRWNGTVHPW